MASLVVGGNCHSAPSQVGVGQPRFHYLLMLNKCGRVLQGRIWRSQCLGGYISVCPGTGTRREVGWWFCYDPFRPRCGVHLDISDRYWSSFRQQHDDGTFERILLAACHNDETVSVMWGDALSIIWAATEHVLLLERSARNHQKKTNNAN